MLNPLNALIILGTLKALIPKIFENASPRFHKTVLDFLLGEGSKKAMALFRGASKTTLINKGGCFCKLYYEQEPYIMIVSSSHKKAKQFLKDIKTMILTANAKGYAIRRGATWTEEAIEVIVKTADGTEHSCRVEAISALMDPRGSAEDFTRPTLIICDDLETKQGKYTIKRRANREELWKWFSGDLLPALDTSGEIWVIGTILHADSLLNKLLKSKTWKHLSIALVTEGRSAWRSRHPMTRAESLKLKPVRGKHPKSVEEIRAGYEEAEDLNTYYQEYLNVPQAVENQLFRKREFNYIKGVRFHDKVRRIVYKTAAEHEIIAWKEAEAIIMDDGSEIPLSSLTIYTTVDIASDGRDRTSIVTRAYDSSGRKYHLDTRSGKWTPYQKSLQIITVYLMFKALRVGMEKGGMQNDFFYTIDVAQKETGVKLPIEGLSHGGVNKNIRIANMEPDYRVGNVYHNRSCPFLDDMEAQLLGFDIDVESLIDDIIDADAYQNQFTQGRTFSDDEWEEEAEGAWS